MKRFLKLLDKDWRLYRGPVIGLVIVTLLPYITMRAIDYYEAPHLVESIITSRDNTTHPPRTVHLTIHYYKGPYARVLGNIQMAIDMGMFPAILMAPVFGACAFAAERRDRFAEFLAMLPIRRRTIISSKFWLAFLLLVLTGAVQWLVGVGLSPWAWILGGPKVYAGFLTPYASWALQFSLGVGMFGAAWLLSIILKSPALAAVVPLAAAVLAIGLNILRNDDFINAVYPLIFASCGIGVIGLLVGNIYYLKRVAP